MKMHGACVLLLLTVCQTCVSAQNCEKTVELQDVEQTIKNQTTSLQDQKKILENYTLLVKEAKKRLDNFKKGNYIQISLFTSAFECRNYFRFILLSFHLFIVKYKSMTIFLFVFSVNDIN